MEQPNSKSLKANNTNTLIKHNGNTQDIASAVLSVYNRDYSQVSELAQTLKDGRVDQTCNNIFDYVIDHVDYKEDPAGVQWVKTPARLISDGFGDCKSMAIFIASCLRCLEIKHVFRFVSFNSKKEATHVYVVVNAGLPDEIIIDPVVRVSGLPKFNHEETFTFKSDMNGTNIYYMAGMPKHVGDTPPEDDSDRYSVWIGDELEPNITPGKHFLYSRFDLLLEMINISTNEKQKAYYFDQLDIVSSLLHAYNHVNGDTEEFKRIAQIISGLVADGFFMSSVTDENLRADNLDELFNEIDHRFELGLLPAKYDLETWDMITNEVLAHNVQAEIPDRIGSFWPWDKVADLIKSSGYYFLYTYIPDNELSNYPAAVTKKRNTENTVKKWLVIDLFHTNATRENLIRSGIIARVGMTPEAYIADCKKNNIKIGNLTAILAIISAVISVLLGLIALVRAIWPPKNTPTNDDVVNGTANVNDELFTMQKKTNPGTGTGVTTSSLSSLALPLALGASLLISMFRNKNKEQ